MTDRPRPSGEVGHEAAESAGEDFRAGRLERRRLRLVPQAIADARSVRPARRGAVGRRRATLAPSPAWSIHVGSYAVPARDRNRSRRARLRCQRRFRNRGCKHDLAARRRHRAIARSWDRSRARRGAPRYRSTDYSCARASNVSVRRISAGARKKHQQRSDRRARRAPRLAQPVARWDARIASEIAGLDRKGAAGAFDDGAFARMLATRVASRVADMTTSFKSSRNPCWRSRAKARPRSASSERSWNSSKKRRRHHRTGVVQAHGA